MLAPASEVNQFLNVRHVLLTPLCLELGSLYFSGLKLSA
jgi:hypothetical protein